MFVGCSTLQNWKNGLKPYKKSKVEAEKPTKLDWDTSPLSKEGTKTFSISLFLQSCENYLKIPVS